MSFKPSGRFRQGYFTETLHYIQSTPWIELQGMDGHIVEFPCRLASHRHPMTSRSGFTAILWRQSSGNSPGLWMAHVQFVHVPQILLIIEPIQRVFSFLRLKFFHADRYSWSRKYRSPQRNGCLVIYNVLCHLTQETSGRHIKGCDFSAS